MCVCVREMCVLRYVCLQVLVAEDVGRGEGLGAYTSSLRPHELVVVA
jgi:hypothetical protein